jgi:hypothetical protein
MLNQPKTYIKAIIATLVAALGALATALTDDVVTGSEWVTVALAAVVAAGGVYGIANRPKSPDVSR